MNTKQMEVVKHTELYLNPRLYPDLTFEDVSDQRLNKPTRPLPSAQEYVARLQGPWYLRIWLKLTNNW
jgi:hypothetical protein